MRSPAKSRILIALLAGSVLITTLNYQSAVAVTGTVSGFVNENGTLTLTAPGGTVKKLAVTLNYESTSSPSTFNSLALSGGGNTAVYRASTTISAEVSVASKVTFNASCRSSVIDNASNRYPSI